MTTSMKKTSAILSAMLALALILVLVAVIRARKPPVDPPTITERPPIAPNGLPAEDRDQFYHLPQGGNFIPFNVFQALEQPASRDLFRENLQRFGFLPDIKNAANPRSLPVGMTIEQAPDLGIPLVGINCTACHVGQIQYEGRSLQIEGSPNLVDFTAFNMEFAQSMEATARDREKLFRFLRRYFSSRDSTADIYSALETYAELVAEGGSLESDFFETVATHFRAEMEAYENLPPHKAHARALDVLFDPEDSDDSIPDVQVPDSLPRSIDDEPLEDGFLAGIDEEKRKGHTLTSLRSVMRDFQLVMARMHLLRMALKNSSAPMTPPGPGRFDAFGMVRNLSFGQYGSSPMTAPTSISPLWEIADHAWYHFLGMTTTVVGRNIAAIDFIVTPDFETTLLFDNINALEMDFRKLDPPAWPDFLPTPDSARVERGRTIFNAAEERYRDTRLGNCAGCHDRAAPYEHDPELQVYPRFTPEELGVDPNLKVTFTTPLTEGLTMAQALTRQIDGIEARFRKERGLTMEQYIETYEHGRDPLQWIDSGQHPARLLHGVWATAPYLHNGSIPNLDALLRPADDRPTTFALGHREFDPVRVGYTLDPPGPHWIFNVHEPVRDVSGRAFPSLPNGNSNRGHEFGVDLTDEERLDLVEYLKTL